MSHSATIGLHRFAHMIKEKNAPTHGQLQSALKQAYKRNDVGGAQGLQAAIVAKRYAHSKNRDDRFHAKRIAHHQKTEGYQAWSNSSAAGMIASSLRHSSGLASIANKFGVTDHIVSSSRSGTKGGYRKGKKGGMFRVAKTGKKIYKRK